MPRDQPVSAKRVLAAVLKVRRRGPARCLENLEREQPELAEYVMEAMSLAHSNLLKLGAAARPTGRVFLEFQNIVLVGAVALGDRQTPETSGKSK